MAKAANVRQFHRDAAVDRRRNQRNRENRRENRYEERGGRQPVRNIRRRVAESYTDYMLLFAIICLVCFGLLMVYSSSSYRGISLTGDSAYFLKRQAFFAVVGVFMMVVISRVNYKKLVPYSKVIFYSCMAMQGLVLILGVASNGATRWLSIGPFQFQPSELTKIGLILYCAYIVTAKVYMLKDFKNCIKLMLLPAAVAALIAKENLSTALICMIIIVTIVFVASPQYKEFFAALIGLGIFGAFFLLTASYRLDRIKTWIHVETDPNAFQTLQSLYAIGSGGLFGKGLGNSIQKGYVPEAHNDMIFSIICEELGLFGAICLIALYIFVIYRLVVIAMNANSLYGSLIIVGVLTHISVQVLVNIAVVTNVIPNTGVTLPFISYGGSSLIFLLMEVGLCLSVSRQMKIM